MYRKSFMGTFDFDCSLQINLCVYKYRLINIFPTVRQNYTKSISKFIKTIDQQEISQITQNFSS